MTLLVWIPAYAGMTAINLKPGMSLSKYVFSDETIGVSKIMQDFIYHNPTKIVFGNGKQDQIGREVAPFARKVLYVYGMSSIKRNGVFDRTTASLRDAGVEIVEYGGVKANPVLPHTREGIALAKREKVDAVVAVGGGSVIDEAKAIAGGAVTDTDIWDFFAQRATLMGALPVFTVLTMSATGTEMNGGTVVTNHDTQQKLGLSSEFFYPKTSILDPTTLVSVPPDQTAYGAIDAVTHLLESYFTKTDPYTPLQDRFVEGVVRTITEIAGRMQERPDDLEARSTFMWAATLAWNGLAPSGVGLWSTPNHLIGHGMSVLYDTAHGASLSITLSGWMPWYVEQNELNEARLAQLGRAVFDIGLNENLSNREAAKKTIKSFRTWFRAMKSPTTPAEIGVSDGGISALAKNIASNSTIWGLPEYTQEVCEGILRRCE